MADHPTIAADRPLPWWERAWAHGWLRKSVLVLAIAVTWQGYARWLDQPLLLPTCSQTLSAWWDALVHGDLLRRSATSLKVLALGYTLGLAGAALLVFLAVVSRLGADLLETASAALNPLPAIALLPLALLWFGLGTPSICFVLVHAVLWPVAISAYAGFAGVPPTLRMVGRGLGMGLGRYTVLILVPAAFPGLLTGLRTGWAFAWRTLVAVELVFGVSSGSGGLGWFIYEHRNLLETDLVFAGLLTVALLGFLVEYGLFRLVEHLTTRRWGMQT